MEINWSELAWAAGFFDGEGCTSLLARVGKRGTKARRYNVPWQVVIRVSQNEPSTLLRFQRAVLGLGHVNGPHKNGGNRKPSWSFHADRFEHVQQIVCLLWPFLSEPKRGQAHTALGLLKEAYAKTTRYERRDGGAS